MKELNIEKGTLKNKANRIESEFNKSNAQFHTLSIESMKLDNILELNKSTGIGKFGL